MLFGRVMLKTTATFGAFLRLWGVRITPIISKAQKARKRPHLRSDSACSSLSCPLSTLLVASFHIKGLIKYQKKYLWYLYFERYTLFWSTNCTGLFASPCMRLPFSFSSQLMILVLGTTISWLSICWKRLAELLILQYCIGVAYFKGFMRFFSLLVSSDQSK